LASLLSHHYEHNAGAVLRYDKTPDLHRPEDLIPRPAKLEVSSQYNLRKWSISSARLDLIAMADCHASKVGCQGHPNSNWGASALPM
jgi:hypothetical protein